MKKLFVYLQIVALIIPIGIFIFYIVAAEGDEFTAEHYLITGLSAIPFVIVQFLKFTFSDVDSGEK
jgi:hypothetical protein